MLAHCNWKQNMCLCSKQSILFSFYALPSGGKLKDGVVHCNKLAHGMPQIVVGRKDCSSNPVIDNFLPIILKGQRWNIKRLLLLLSSSACRRYQWGRKKRPDEKRLLRLKWKRLFSAKKLSTKERDWEFSKNFEKRDRPEDKNTLTKSTAAFSYIYCRKFNFVSLS